MRGAPISKAFKASLIMHGVLVFLLLVVPLLSKCRRPPKKENIIFVEMVSPAPPAPQQPQPPKPEPPKPEPPKPEPPKPEPPKPEPPKPVEEVKKREVKVNTNRIVRTETPPPPAPAPRAPSLADLRKDLLSPLPTSTTPATTGTPSELGAYYGTIQRIMYEAWRQPPGVAGLRTQVKIRIARNGSIMLRERVAGSGSEAMDDSVMNAVRSVSRLPRLPDAVKDAFFDVTITFESTGLSM